MKTAALDPSFDSRFGTDLLPALHLHRAAPVGAAQPEPVCWRSEAFAEDLSDLLPDEPAAPARQPLLRRALAAVLRR